jgi:glycerol uptake facilitator-like aquaporin
MQRPAPLIYPQQTSTATILIETPLAIRLWSEFLATFLSITGAVGASLVRDELASVAVAAGFSLGAATFAFFAESRAHTNPTATVADILLRRIPLAWLLPYWVMQFAATFAATGVMFAILQDSQWNTIRPVIGAGYSSSQAVMAEFVGAFLLRLTILATTENISDLLFEEQQSAVLRQKLQTQNPETVAMRLLLAETHQSNQYQLTRVTGALAIDLTMTALTTLFAPVSGNSLFNPFRQIVAAILLNTWHNYDWIYTVGPFAGACLAVIAYYPIQSARSEIRMSRKAKLF